ncbi:hypothetical protein GUITHDRAFT_156754, partial [Guillardia theta CCMP2712]
MNGNCELGHTDEIGFGDRLPRPSFFLPRWIDGSRRRRRKQRSGLSLCLQSPATARSGCFLSLAAVWAEEKRARTRRLCTYL